MNGLHIIANFYNCSFDFSKEQELLPFCKQLCIQNGLSVVGQTSFLFQPQGLTFALILAESHLSIHTWPEDHNIAFDIYTCNINNDNSLKTKNVYEELKNLLRPERIDVKFIERESLN